MREILFRAKVKDKDELIGKGFPIDENGNPISEWVYGVSTPIPGYPDLFTAWNEFNGEYEEITVITDTIGQYTGLTDKNGLTKIFEGDVIKHNGENFIVYWNEKCAGFYPLYDQDNPIGYGVIGEESEVIGNIFDNHELLEVEGHE